MSNLLVFCSKHPSTVPGEGDETLPALIWTCWPRKSSSGPRKVTFFLQNRLAAPEPRFSFPTFDAEHKNHIILDWFKVVTTHGSPISEQTLWFFSNRSLKSSDTHQAHRIIGLQKSFEIKWRKTLLLWKETQLVQNLWKARSGNELSFNAWFYLQPLVVATKKTPPLPKPLSPCSRVPAALQLLFESRNKLTTDREREQNKP